MEIFRGRSLSLKIAQASLRKPPRSVFTVENSVNHVGHLLLRPLLTTLRTVTGRMGSTAKKCPVTRRRPGGPAWTTAHLLQHHWSTAVQPQVSQRRHTSSALRFKGPELLGRPLPSYRQRTKILLCIRGLSSPRALGPSLPCNRDSGSVLYHIAAAARFKLGATAQCTRFPENGE